MSSINMPSSPIVPQEAALRVVKGSLASAIAATTFGSIYGIMKAQPASLYAFQSGANTFVFAFPFFALREYVISPIISSDRSSIRTRDVGASALSGTVVGGALSAYYRGPQKMLAGATTFGILCTSLQLVGNELRVLRVRYLSSLESKDETTTDSPSASLRKPDSRIESSPVPIDSPPQLPPSVTSTSKEEPSSWLQRTGSYISSFSPVRKLTDEEYQEQLLDRRRKVIEELSKVEQSIPQEQITSGSSLKKTV